MVPPEDDVGAEVRCAYELERAEMVRRRIPGAAGFFVVSIAAATIVDRDESGYTYAVETTGTTTAKAGWFKRAITLGRAGTKTTARVQLTVRVAAEGAGSRVSVEGADDDASRDAARALLQTLRERLS